MTDAELTFMLQNQIAAKAGGVLYYIGKLDVKKIPYDKLGPVLDKFRVMDQQVADILQDLGQLP
jgi:hypothetical protein